MTRTFALRRLWLGLAIGLLAALGGTASVLMLTVAHAQDPAVQGGALPVGEVSGAPPTNSAPVPPAKAAGPVGPTVRIVFKVIPPNRATVTWGKKKLGFIKPRASLIIERPRDSGPLDVVVRAENCLPVHTRVYTFSDTTLAVRVTPLDKKNTLYGYREDPPPEADGGAPGTTGAPDGGVASPEGSP